MDNNTIINEILKLVKFKNFLSKFTTISLTGGIAHRAAGKGTNSLDKRSGYTKEDLAQLKPGLIACGQHIIDEANKIKLDETPTE